MCLRSQHYHYQKKEESSNIKLRKSTHQNDGDQITYPLPPPNTAVPVSLSDLIGKIRVEIYHEIDGERKLGEETCTY